VPAFWSGELIAAIVLNAVLQTLQIGAYAARLAGVQTARVATSISLFNLFVTASRFANMFYAPMLGTVSDTASAALRANPGAEPAIAAQFEWQLRFIVFAGTLGTALGAALLPTFAHLFRRGIASFERYGSLPRAIMRLSDPAVVGSVVKAVRVPQPGIMARFSPRAVPARLLIANVVVTGIYAIGVVAAVYASVLDPAQARTTTLLSGIINGLATISFTLFVDPTSSLIVDKAVKGEKTMDDVRALVFWLCATAIIGTLLSQLILTPATWVIVDAAHLLRHGR
jgi:fluoride ion exporter CrcB/FEX